jgi:hypothetical protein
MLLSSRLWKLLGLAGVAGVTATGVIIARNQRARAQLTPDEVRRRLRERVEESQRAGQDPGAEPVGGPGNPGSAGNTESSARA